MMATSDDDVYQTRLSWRSDPDESFSDYTIRVTRQDSAGTATDDVYHVHRSVLAFGPFASGYFKIVFRQKIFIEGQTQCTCLTLSEEEADAFPVLLDCMYEGMFNGNDISSVLSKSIQLDNDPSLESILEAPIFRLIDYLDMAELRSYVISKMKWWSIQDIPAVPSFLDNRDLDLHDKCLQGLATLASFNGSFLEDAVSQPAFVDCMFDVLFEWDRTTCCPDEREKIDRIHENAVQVMTAASPYFIAMFSDRMTSLFEHLQMNAFANQVIFRVGHFVKKIGLFSKECFDALVGAGMIELLLNTVIKGDPQDGFHWIASTISKYPTRAPIQRYATGFPAIWRILEGEGPTSMQIEIIIGLVNAISQYNDDDRMFIINIGGCTPLGKALLFPWTDYPHLYCVQVSKEIDSDDGDDDYGSFELIPRRDLVHSPIWSRNLFSVPAFIDVFAYLAAGTPEEVRDLSSTFMSNLTIVGTNWRSFDSKIRVLINLFITRQDVMTRRRCAKIVPILLNHIESLVEKPKQMNYGSTNEPIELRMLLLELIMMLHAPIRLHKSDLKILERLCLVQITSDHCDLPHRCKKLFQLQTFKERKASPEKMRKRAQEREGCASNPECIKCGFEFCLSLACIVLVMSA